MLIDSFPSSRQSSQCGSVIVQFALLITALIAVLGVVQIGYMYHAKRDLQRIADLAAMVTVNAVSYGNTTTCPTAQIEGKKSIDAQLTLYQDQAQSLPTCGHWDATTGFTSNGAPLNAAQVTLRVNTLQLLPFTGERYVSATAMAVKSSEPVAAFSVGSQLLCGTLIGQVTGVNLCLLNSDGVLNAKITPASLLQQLGIDLDLGLLTPTDVAKIPKIKITDLISASASLVGESTANVFISLLAQLKADIGKLEIPLIGTAGSPGIFTLATLGNGKFGHAADVQISAFDIIGTALAIGTKDHAIDAGVNLIGGLVSSKIKIISPPSYASGPAKPTITKAYNSQIRLNLETNSLGSVLGLPLLPLKISVDLVNGEGTLEKISCEKNPRTVDISVNSSIGKICIGSLNASGSTCEPMVALLGLVTVKAEADLLPASHQILVDIEKGSTRQSQINDLQIGSTLTSLLGNLEIKLIGINLGPVTSLVSAILEPALKGILNNLGGFLSSAVLKNLLGLNIGETKITVSDIKCDTAQLVN